MIVIPHEAGRKAWHPSMRLPRSATAVLVAAALVCGATACAPSDNQKNSDEPRQCLYSAHDLLALRRSEATFGVVPDCAVVFHDEARSWEEWAEPWFLRTDDPRQDWGGWVRDSGNRNRLIISQALVPKNPPADWREQGAAGAYDGHAVQLARALVRAGLGSSTVRLGGEANGTWNHDNAGDTVEQRAQWATFWANTVRAMRSVEGADFTFDWSVNAAVRPIPFHEYYPGDEVVDVIGIDQYDTLVGSDARGETRWHEIRTQPAGLDALLTFADARGKPVSVPEAGLVEPGQHGAGDNPAYVRGLRSALADVDVDYIAYFDHNANGTLRLDQVPNAAAEWRAWVKES